MSGKEEGSLKKGYARDVEDLVKRTWSESFLDSIERKIHRTFIKCERSVSTINRKGNSIRGGSFSDPDIMSGTKGL